MKVEVKEAYAYEGPAVQYTGDDGYPDAVIMPVLVAVAADGRMFQLPNGIVREYDEDGFGGPRPRWNICKADEMAAAINARKFINAEHWHATSEAGLRDYNRGTYQC
jgi:hypothetical protein